MLKEDWCTVFGNSFLVYSKNLKNIAIGGYDLVFFKNATIFLDDLLEGVIDIRILTKFDSCSLLNQLLEPLAIKCLKSLLVLSNIVFDNNWLSKNLRLLIELIKSLHRPRSGHVNWLNNHL